MEKVSFINQRGRVIWAETQETAKMLKLGFRLIANPQQAYYPQYDQQLNKDIDTAVLVHDSVDRELEVEEV